MKLLSIIIDGFGSFADKTEIQFDTFITHVLGTNNDAKGKSKSNGAGKSTIVDAVVWAIYGRTSTGRQKDGIVCHFRKKAYVELALEGLTIIREKERGKGEKLKFRYDGGEWVYGDLGETTLRLGIESRLSFDTFCNTVFIGRSAKTVRFLEATPSERLSVFSSLLDTSRYTEAAALVSEEISNRTSSIGHTQAYLRALQDVELNLRRDAQRLTEQLTEAREKSAEAKVAIHKEKKALELEKVEIQQSLLMPPSGDMDALQAEKVKLQRKLEGDRDVLAEYKVRLSNVKPLEEGDLCPSCLRELGEDDAITLDNTTDDLKALIKAKQGEMSETATLIHGINESQERIRHFRSAAKEGESRIREIEAELRHLGDRLLVPDISILSESLRSKVRDLETNVSEQKKRQASIAKEMPLLEKDKVVRKAFTTEIRNMLLDKIRMGLDRYSNTYLSMLAGEDYKISFPATTKTGRETFDIALNYSGHTQDISSFSGGETWKASFAVILALRSVLEERNNSPFQFLFVDDPLGPLDDVGSSAFLDLLCQLSSEGKLPQILVTLPREVKTDKRVRTIEVIKERRVSRIC